MELLSYDYAIIGGDLRQIYIAELLQNKGYTIILYAIDSSRQLTKYTQADSLEQAVTEAKVIIGPIPFQDNHQIIKHTTKLEDMDISHLSAVLQKEQKVFGGAISKDFVETCAKNEIECYDLMKDESVSIFNTIATAEGSIAEAIIHYPGNLKDSQCLVLGYGKCGKTLAIKLQAMGANTTVCARKTMDREWAKTYGAKSIDFNQLPKCVNQYEIIFNTIPEVVINKEILLIMNREAVVIDIASAPGGVDYDSAKSLGLNAALYPGLPGKYAPKASADAIVKCILKNE